MHIRLYPNVIAQMHGVSVPNPYRFNPVPAPIRVPVNFAFFGVVNLYNPHHEGILQVEQYYASMDGLSLESPEAFGDNNNNNNNKHSVARNNWQLNLNTPEIDHGAWVSLVNTARLCHLN